MTTGQTRNPAMADEVVCEYARADRSQTLKALHAARDAAPLWAQALPQRRADALGAVARELQQRRQTLATLLAGETGRPLSEALSEVRQAAQRFQLLSARAARGATAQVLNGEGGLHISQCHEPRGVLALITSFASPLLAPARHLAAALAAGNTIVFKPAERASACGHALAEILVCAGFPAGVFNLLMGSGRQVGKTLFDSALVQGRVFCGSTQVAQKLGGFAQGLLHAGWLIETPSPCALVVLADADLERAVECALQGAYLSHGHSRFASPRIVVEDSVHADFVRRLSQRLRSLKAGDPRQKVNTLGPMADREAVLAFEAVQQVLREKGGHESPLVLRSGLPTQGHFVPPALWLLDSPAQAPWADLRGPLACVLKAANVHEASQLACPGGACLRLAVVTASTHSTSPWRRQFGWRQLLLNLPTTSALVEEPEDQDPPFYVLPRTSYVLA